MNRQTVPLVVVLLIGCFILGWVWNAPSVGQAPAGPAGKVGKYQVSTAGAKNGAMLTILCDTETGQMWEKYGITDLDANNVAGTWKPIASPIGKQK